MLGIPPAKDTDAEDVVWGLQTAETLWKRGERIDAVVWLRRAAQAAGESADDDRALELARSAAELSDWMATLPVGMSDAPPPMAPNASHLAHGPPTYVPDGGPGGIEVDMAAMEGRRGLLPEIAVPPPVPGPRPMPPVSRPPSQPTMQTGEPAFPAEPERDRRDAARQTPMASLEPHDSAERPRTTSVPPAEKVHAGMYNPWDDRASTSPAVPIAPPPPLAPRFTDEEEVITSIRPQQLEQQRADALAAALAGGSPQSQAPPPPAPVAWAEPVQPEPPQPEPPKPEPPRTAPPKPEPPRTAPPRPAPGRPPPLPARAMKPRAPSAHAGPRVASEPPMRVTPPPPSPTQVMLQQAHRVEAAPPPVEPPEPIADTARAPVHEEPLSRAPVHEEPLSRAPVHEEPLSRAPLEDADLTPLTPMVAPVADAPPPAAAAPTTDVPPRGAPATLDLDDVEAFADLPDDARRAFASAAEVSALAEGEEVSSFALAYIMSGSVDVAATMVDAPAARLEGGAVLRSRGTTQDGVPMRLIGVSSGVVATWTDAAVQEAFRTCPWVEEDLRVAADRLQTLVGVTIGPLGERLDASIREQIIARLTMRTLIAGDVVVTAGEQMPGLLLVGIGELELVDGDRVAGVVGSGEFLFPTEVLGGGNAPNTARAGAGGALILFGDRKIAQELLVTCPPLLEVFAGM